MVLRLALDSICVYNAMRPVQCMMTKHLNGDRFQTCPRNVL
jgi:hypothetical protein